MTTSAHASRPESGDAGRATADAGYPDLPEGAWLGRFRVERRLDRFGANCIYAANDTSTGEAVAIKLGRHRRGSDGRRESDEQVLARLRREADILRQLDQVAVPHFKGLNERPPYLVLEMVDAVDLERVLKTQAHDFGARALAALLMKLAEILTAIHVRGFLHGDIKPANILIRADGSPLLIDFGSARRLAAPDEEDADDWSLTPDYAPPEFYQADGVLGPWSDVYSLGAVAYQIVTGRRPVSAEARLRGAPMPSAIDLAGPSYPIALSGAIDWALELDPAARPFSAEAWRRVLREAAEARADTDPSTLRIRRRIRPETGTPDQSKGAAKPSGRRPHRVFGAALGLATLVLSASALLAGRELYQLYENQTKQAWIVDLGGQGDTATIGAALARAREGATIRVRPGVYQESLAIARPVDLLGINEGDQQPVIAPANGPCVAVTASMSRVAGLRLRGAKGANGEDVPCVEVSSGRVTVENTRVSAASGAGVLARSGAELRLVDSEVADSGGAGVAVAGDARATLSGGAILDSGRSGVIARSGANLHIVGTYIGRAREAGVLLAEGAVARIENATIDESGTSGVEIRSGAQGAVADGVIVRAVQAGAFVLDAGKATFERTQISNNGFSGLIVAGGGEVSVDAGVFEANREHGVLVLELASGTITSSRIIGNAGHGLALQRGAKGDMTDTVVERNREPQVFDGRRSDPALSDRRRGGPS